MCTKYHLQRSRFQKKISRGETPGPPLLTGPLRGGGGGGEGGGKGGDVEGPGKWSAPGPALAVGGPARTSDPIRPARRGPDPDRHTRQQRRALWPRGFCPGNFLYGGIRVNVSRVSLVTYTVLYHRMADSLSYMNKKLSWRRETARRLYSACHTSPSHLRSLKVIRMTPLSRACVNPY